jgi:hypothetical protein
LTNTKRLGRYHNLSTTNNNSTIYRLLKIENDPKYDTLLGSKGGVFCGKQNSTEYKDRCGYGPRLPLIIISPYSKVNYDIQRS